ncbi:universal stress protein [Pelagibius marinus]|uniref:universal stress protein n=1 Tax=Pelagibius marinus TaxID=2762760 RepID=UPI0018725E52|nr:universal stress protein [Pelagibius marinus]
MAKLIALVDGSIYSESVCDHAAWIAGRGGAEIELLHVLGRRETSSEPANLSGNITLGARTALLEELSALDEQRAKLAQKRGRAILEDAAARLAAGGAGRVTSKLRIGDFVETVAELEPGAEMIVVGKRGEAADFAKLHLGSNLERVVRASHKPVFVASRAFKPIKRFLIAYDGGTSAMKAIDYIARSDLFAGLECRLISVGGDSPENRKRLDDAKALLEGGGYRVETGILAGQPDRAIAEAVEAEGIDLLVMGAYGHSRIRTLIIGSTTTEMLRSCKVPVVLFR